MMQWHPAPADLIADLATARWSATNPAPMIAAYLWAWRQLDDGANPSIRDVADYAGRGKTWAQRVLARAREDWTEWGSRYVSGQQRDSSGTAAGQLARARSFTYKYRHTYTS